MTALTVPPQCEVCREGARGPSRGCVTCQWSGEADWTAPARWAEFDWMREHAPELGSDPPASMVAPGQWRGHGRMVGCSGAIEDGRGVAREFAVEVTL